MRRLFRSAKKGALAGWVLGGAVGVLTIISGAGPKDGLALRLFLAFMVAGFYGAVPGAVVGGLVGLVKGRSRSGAPSLPPAPLGVPFPVAPPTPAPDRGNWIGVIGEALETRATVLSVKPYSDLWATRALRYLHYLRTPDGQVLRWLANEDRGLSAGKEVILRGTIKDHTWDSAGQAGTEVWYCQTRPAPRPRFAPPVTRDEAAPQPRPTPTSKPESKPPSERPKVEVDRAAVIRGANEMRSKAAQEKEPRDPPPAPTDRTSTDGKPVMYP